MPQLCLSTYVSVLDEFSDSPSCPQQIALQAQSRKCKLYPSASDYTSSLLLYTPGPAATRSAPVQPLQDNSPPRRKESSERSAQYSALNVDLNLGPELLDQVETKQSAKHHIPSPAKGNKIIEAFHTKDSRDPGPSASSECLGSTSARSVNDLKCILKSRLLQLRPKREHHWRIQVKRQGNTRLSSSGATKSKSQYTK